MSAGQSANQSANRFQRPHLQTVDGLLRLDLHFHFIDGAQKAGQETPAWLDRLGPQGKIGRDVQVFAECQILIDDLDTKIRCIGRAANKDLLSVQPEFTFIGQIGPGQNLHQG